MSKDTEQFVLIVFDEDMRSTVEGPDTWTRCREAAEQRMQLISGYWSVEDDESTFTHDASSVIIEIRMVRPLTLKNRRRPKR
jgi:hypothetical protein